MRVLEEAKVAAKTLTAAAVHHSGARKVIASIRRMAAGGRRVVILGYHRVAADFEAERANAIESCIIGRRSFEAHVAFLAGNFELATMSRALDVLAGRATATRDLAVITFDDGYRDVLENAVPVLRDFRAPATIYISSGVVENGGHFPHDRLHALLVAWQGSERMRERIPQRARSVLEQARRQAGGGARQWVGHLIETRSPAVLEVLCDDLAEASDRLALPAPGTRALDWDGVRELAANDFEIGAHTVHHCVLTRLSPEARAYELRASKAAIEAAIGRPVRHFAYCNGYYNDAVIRAVREAGYVSALTTEDRLNFRGQDPYRLARRVVWEGSGRGPLGRMSRSMIACQLDEAWISLGLSRCVPGEQADCYAEEGAPQQARRLA